MYVVPRMSSVDLHPPILRYVYVPNAETVIMLPCLRRTCNYHRYLAMYVRSRYERIQYLPKASA